MAYTSSYGRKEEKKQQRRLVIAIIGSILLIAFVIIFGLKILVGFSLLVEKIRGGSPATQTQQRFLAAPVLNSLPEATNSATLVITGSATPGTTMIVYVNDQEQKKLTIEDNGKFSLRDLSFKEGKNTVSSKVIDESGTTSDLSNVVMVTIKKTPPNLELTSPDANSTIKGDTNTVDVNGVTDEDSTISINGRFVMVKNDHTFFYQYPLNEGDNVLKIIATDRAGNQTIVERRVMYQK